MKKVLIGLVRLSRLDEYFFYVIITTLFGVIASQHDADWQLLLLLPANWFAVGFAYMIFEIEEAPNDVLAHSKITKNPVSTGVFTPATAKTITFSIGFISMMLFLILGIWPFIFGFASLALGYFYAFRSVRKKKITLYDILILSLTNAGFQFLAGYSVYADIANTNWLWPLILVLSISISQKLVNRLQPPSRKHGDKPERPNDFKGRKTPQILLLIALFCGLFSGSVTLIILELIPVWVIMLAAISTGIFVMPALFSKQNEEKPLSIRRVLKKPLEGAVALALICYYLIPWLDHVLNLGLF